MKAGPITRTINPLPFDALDPSRFEDLVRQLAYDLRAWTTLEAMGRSGSDDGVDIRGVEGRAEYDGDDGSDDSGTPEPGPPRVWLFQCKRVKQFGPKAARAVIEAALRGLDVAPHGFVVAVACDVSKQARDAFRAEAVARGISEFMVWARSELEDMLFQRHNDRLLFAFFGLSLRPQRTARASELRRSIAMKARVLHALDGDPDGGLGGDDVGIVVIRDPTDTTYPRRPSEEGRSSRWSVHRVYDARSPDGLAVITKSFYAASRPEGEWDALMSLNLEPELRARAKSSNSALPESYKHDCRLAHELHREFIAADERATLLVVQIIAWDRVIAVDQEGDRAITAPHIFVECMPGSGPFTEQRRQILHFETGAPHRRDQVVDEARRVGIFPSKVPSELYPPPPCFEEHVGEAPMVALADREALVAEARALRSSKVRGFTVPKPFDDPLSGAAVDEGAFSGWLEAEVLPVLHSCVESLRAEGIPARIAVRRRAERSVMVELRLWRSLEDARSNPSLGAACMRVQHDWDGVRVLECASGLDYGRTPEHTQQVDISDARWNDGTALTEAVIRLLQAVAQREH